jgi:hypothetical protein
MCIFYLEEEKINRFRFDPNSLSGSSMLFQMNESSIKNVSLQMQQAISEIAQNTFNFDQFTSQNNFPALSPPTQNSNFNLNSNSNANASSSASANAKASTNSSTNWNSNCNSNFGMKIDGTLRIGEKPGLNLEIKKGENVNVQSNTNISKQIGQSSSAFMKNQKYMNNTLATLEPSPSPPHQTLNNNSHQPKTNQS